MRVFEDLISDILFKNVDSFKALKDWKLMVVLLKYELKEKSIAYSDYENEIGFDPV